MVNGRNIIIFVKILFFHNSIVKESINGNDFIVVTPSGQCLTVLLPPILSSSHLYLPYLVHTQKRALSKEEKEEYYLDFSFFMKNRYSDEIAKQHLSDESSIDMEVIRTEEQLLVNHRLYLRGILSRKNGLLTLSYNKDCKLVISAKEINSLNVTRISNKLINRIKIVSMEYSVQLLVLVF